MGYGDTELSQIEAAPIKISIRKPGNRGTGGKEKSGAGRPARGPLVSKDWLWVPNESRKDRSKLRCQCRRCQSRYLPAASHWDRSKLPPSRRGPPVRARGPGRRLRAL